MNWITLVVIAGATARLTRLVTTDKIFERPRDWILDRVDPHGFITYLLGCPWCVSIYVGAAMAPIGTYLGEEPYVTIPAVALTLSYITGCLETLSKGDD
jgi:hypothetical protein